MTNPPDVIADVERLAVAMYVQDSEPMDPPWRDLSPMVQDTFMRLARIALAELGLLDGSAVVVPREATEEMLDHAVHLVDEDTLKLARLRTQEVWQLMIAAAHPNRALR